MWEHLNDLPLEAKMDAIREAVKDALGLIISDHTNNVRDDRTQREEYLSSQLRRMADMIDADVARRR